MFETRESMKKARVMCKNNMEKSRVKNSFLGKSCQMTHVYCLKVCVQLASSSEKF